MGATERRAERQMDSFTCFSTILSLIPVAHSQPNFACFDQFCRAGTPKVVPISRSGSAIANMIERKRKGGSTAYLAQIAIKRKGQWGRHGARMFAKRSSANA
jgi:hypothetical protein